MSGYVGTMKKKWSELNPKARKAIVALGSIDAALRTAALIDLKRRSADQVNGSKRLWAAGLTMINSAGVLPVVYYLRGRRPSAG